nr:hypothetical protein [Tanacetum cinerariifolium]
VVLKDAKDVAAVAKNGQVADVEDNTNIQGRTAESQAQIYKINFEHVNKVLKKPKPLKKQAQIEQDEKYTRELEAKLNRTIDWDEVINHVNKKAKEDNAVKRYQAIKRKP